MTSYEIQYILSAHDNASAMVRNLHKSITGMDRDVKRLGRTFAQLKTQIRSALSSLGKTPHIKIDTKRAQAALKSIKPRPIDVKVTANVAAAQKAINGLHAPHLAAQVGTARRTVKGVRDRGAGVSAPLGGGIRGGLGVAPSTLVGVAASAGIGAFFKTQFLDVASQTETLKTVLGTIEGSSQKANESLAWVQKFAAKTPYELAEVSEAFVRMRAYGLQPTDGMLESLGNAASAMGKPIMAAVEMIADASTGEFERLKEFGIKATGKGAETMLNYVDAAGQQQAIRVDRNNRKMIESAIQSIFNSKYSGAMDKQSQTWAGMVSNMQDYWAKFAGMVMDSDIFANMKDWLGGLLERLNEMAQNGELQEWADKVSKMIKKGFAIAVFAVKALAAVLAANTIVGGFTSITGAIGKMTSASSLAGGGLGGIKAGLLSLISPAGLAVGAIAAIGYMAMESNSKYDVMSNATNRAGAALTDLGKMFDLNIDASKAWDFALLAVNVTLGGLITIFTNVVDSVMSGVKAISQVFSGDFGDAFTTYKDSIVRQSTRYAEFGSDTAKAYKKWEQTPTESPATKQQRKIDTVRKQAGLPVNPYAPAPAAGGAVAQSQNAPSSQVAMQAAQLQQASSTTGAQSAAQTVEAAANMNSAATTQKDASSQMSGIISQFANAVNTFAATASRPLTVNVAGGLGDQGR